MAKRNRPIDLYIETKSVKKLDQRLKKLGEEIVQDVSLPKNFFDEIEDTKQGLLENSPGFKNAPEYTAMKESLEASGNITHSSPLSVTGRMIHDLQYQIMNTSPDQVNASVGFADVTRRRPTLKSMWRVYYGKANSLEFKESSSAEVAEKLLNRFGERFTEAIADLYSNDYVMKVERIIQEALRRV